MKDSGLRLVSRWQVEEPEYNLSTEAQTAALLTTGNGYIGVRASLEELGSLGVQGCYVRGIIDTIVDMRLPYCDNLYMKTQYFDEDISKAEGRRANGALQLLKKDSGWITWSSLGFKLESWRSVNRSPRCTEK